MAEMLTGGKIATTLGLSPAKVKKLIAELDIKPDEVKGRCSYYGPKSVEKIKNAL